jgi:hypothetical protein
MLSIISGAFEHQKSWKWPPDLGRYICKESCLVYVTGCSSGICEIKADEPADWFRIRCPAAAQMSGKLEFAKTQNFIVSIRGKITGSAGIKTKHGHQLFYFLTSGNLCFSRM